MENEFAVVTQNDVGLVYADDPFGMFDETSSFGEEQLISAIEESGFPSYWVTRLTGLLSVLGRKFEAIDFGDDGVFLTLRHSAVLVTEDICLGASAFLSSKYAVCVTDVEDVGKLSDDHGLFFLIHLEKQSAEADARKKSWLSEIGHFPETTMQEFLRDGTFSGDPFLLPKESRLFYEFHRSYCNFLTSLDIPVNDLTWKDLIWTDDGFSSVDVRLDFRKAFPLNQAKASFLIGLMPSAEIG